jgi:hypothetical protein
MGVAIGVHVVGVHWTGVALSWKREAIEGIGRAIRRGWHWITGNAEHADEAGEAGALKHLDSVFDLLRELPVEVIVVVGAVAVAVGLAGWWLWSRRTGIPLSLPGFVRDAWRHVVPPDVEDVVPGQPERRQWAAGTMACALVVGLLLGLRAAS